MRCNLTILLLLTLALASCDTHDPYYAEDAAREGSPQVSLRVAPEHALGKKGKTDGNGNGGSAVTVADRAAIMQAYMTQANADLKARGLNIAIARAEWVGGGGRHEAGQTVFAHDRDLRLPYQWIPGDPERNADGNNLTYVVDQDFAMANWWNLSGQVDAEPAIDAAFATWNDVNCSNLNIVKRPDVGIGYSALLNTGDEVNDPFYADISTIGFIPPFIFDAVLGPGASQNVLAVTLTFVWVDENDNPLDMNGDGYLDTALTEIWYNDGFVWSTDGSGVDIETVALHENGHALGLGHFGKVFVTEANNKLHVAPRAAMNAFILGTLRDPLGTDNGGFCSLYASWPR